MSKVVKFFKNFQQAKGEIKRYPLIPFLLNVVKAMPRNLVCQIIALASPAHYCRLVAV